jgi:hypothetical protein
LRNLFGFLPPQIKVTFVSMQEPRAFSSTETFVAKLFETAAAAVKDESAAIPIPRETTLSSLFSYLGAINTSFGKQNSRLLLALDEYENIDVKLGDATFSPDLLPTIRESIQSHRNITWLFSGSNEVTRLKNADWSSYLISARTIEVPLFTPEETTKLLTDPCKHSDLFKDAPENRPLFPQDFWGTVAGAPGITSIQHHSGGWPHLVQLIAETVVDEINRTSGRQVTAQLFTGCLDKVIVKGHTVFHQLVRGECESDAEWDYLCGFQQSDTQSPPTGPCCPSFASPAHSCRRAGRRLASPCPSHAKMAAGAGVRFPLTTDRLGY